MIIAFFELLEAEGQSFRRSLLRLGQSFALLLCAVVIMTVGLLCLLAAVYMGLSSTIGVSYGLLATGGTGLSLGFLIWWLGGRLSR